MDASVFFLGPWSALSCLPCPGPCGPCASSPCSWSPPGMVSSFTLRAGAWGCDVSGDRAESPALDVRSTSYPLPSWLWKTHSRKFWLRLPGGSGLLAQAQPMRETTPQPRLFTEGRSARVCAQANLFSLRFDFSSLGERLSSCWVSQCTGGAHSHRPCGRVKAMHRQRSRKRRHTCPSS